MTAGGSDRLSSSVVTTPETAAITRGGSSPGYLSPTLTSTVFAVLSLLGAAVGMLSTTGAGWLTRYWDAGAPVPFLAAAGLLAFLVLLYGVCRLCAWGSRRGSGAVAFAVGYLAVLVCLVSYLPGGDVVLTNHIMHNAYLFGSVLTLMVAIIRSGVFLVRTGTTRP